MTSKPTEEFLECLDIFMETLDRAPEEPDEVEAELIAAMFGAVDLGMALLVEHMEALTDLRKAEDALAAKEKKERALWRPE